MVASVTACGRAQFSEMMLEDIEGKVVDSTVFDDKTELTHAFDCDESWAGLLFTGVARVRAVGTASILVSNGVLHLSAQLKWASTGNSSGASMILVSLLMVLRQFKNSIRRFGRASFSLTQLLTERENSSEVVVVTMTLKDSNSGFIIKLKM